MPRMALTALAVLAFAYAVACAALFVFQRSLIYFPQPRSSDADASLLELPVDGEKVLVSSRPSGGRHALIYFGGNAEDVSFSLPSLAGAFPDHAIYLLHYRGYGGSSGKPSEATLSADALALFDRVHAEHPDIAVVGRSLGSGVAVRLASQRPVARLVLVTPYDSVEALAVQQFLFFPVRWLLRDRFESWKHAAHVDVPTLLIAAEHDEVIPRASTELLFRHFRAGVAELQVVPRTSHNTISESRGYLPLLLRGAQPRRASSSSASSGSN